MMFDDFLSTPDERFWVNTGGHIRTRTDLQKEELLQLLTEAENSYRQILARTLSCDATEAYAHPLVVVRKKPDLGHLKHRPLFLQRQTYDQKSPVKFAWLTRSLATRNWLIGKGAWPEVQRSDGSYYYPAKSPDFNIGEFIESLENDEVVELVYDLLVGENRISIRDGLWAKTIEADFDSVRATIKKELKSSVDDVLHVVFENGIKKERGKVGISPKRRAALHFLFFLAVRALVTLPATQVSEQKFGIAYTYGTVFRGPAIREICPPNKWDELKFCESWIRESHKGRALSFADVVTLFCCSNYGSANGFAPEALDIVRTALAGTHQSILYAHGCINFYGVSSDEARAATDLISGRRSKKILTEDPFALFRADPKLVRKSMSVQVRSFENRTGRPFPCQFDPDIVAWADELESLIKLVPRRNVRELYKSGILWMTYLSMLPPQERPRGFQDVERALHIRNVKDPHKFTFISFLDQLNVDSTNDIKGLQQIFSIRATEAQADKQNPVHARIDWKNRDKSFRTKRKSIPELIVETLIEQNARPADDGTPYGLFQEWKDDSKATTIRRIDGRPIDQVIPCVAAVIDCILHLGMRSSSARWLDSGQGDEYRADIGTKELVPNPAAQAEAGSRRGFLQVMDIGPGHTVLSLLMLKNKTVDEHEIPYMPEQLARRLEIIRVLQDRYNPVESPVRAIENDEIINDRELVPEVYPLFRDPSRYDAKPVSATKVREWWKRLLEHCEPIVHERRKQLLGDDALPYPFFDNQGAPIWDVHSIRVAVVTALLEMGVSPTIVQHLVGHKSPIMTLHYHAIDNQKTHTAISEALEKRRLAAANAIAGASNEEELESAIQGVLGGLITTGGDDGVELAASLLKRSNTLAGTGASFSVFSHGICPGGDCSQGGERRGNYLFGVHRDKACSRCRFRITGPAFLNGLIMNANILMSEISEATTKEHQLNAEILEATQRVAPTAVLEARVNQEREFKDQLWADWAAEYRTIDQCVKALDAPETAGGLPALPTQITQQISEGHHLRLLQSIVSDSSCIAGASVDLTDGLKARRNEMLWDIAANNADVSRYLISLPKQRRSQAMDEFGEMVAALDAQAAGGDNVVEAFIDGSRPLPDLIFKAIASDEAVEGAA